MRGGSWDDVSHYVACAFRDGNKPNSRDPNIGFRCVRIPKPTDEPKHTRRAAYIIPKSGNCIFLLARKKWLDEGTPWIFPGGGLRQNETPVNGAIREFYEETGSEPDRDELKHILTEKTKWSDEIHFFLWDTIGYWEASELCACDKHKFFGWMWLDITLPNLEKSVIWPTLMPGAQAAIKKLREVQYGY